jgi:hypothetical protein
MRRTDQWPARIAEEPRPLTVAEAKVIRAVLDYADFDGRDVLVAQISSARVVSRCGCGCATVDLRVGDPIEGRSTAEPIPNEADVIDGDGQPVGGVMVFVTGGLLSMLEVYSNGDEPIDPLPALSSLDLYQRGSSPQAPSEADGVGDA